MKNNLSIVFLWAEVGGYLEAVLKSLSSQPVGIINVVHWDKRNLNTTQHEITNLDKVIFHARSEANDELIFKLLEIAKPEIVVVSGWMDKGYIRVCKKYKKKCPNVKIVAGIDDMWVGSLRQRLGQIYYNFFYRKLFDFMWISGQPQFSFAQRFGYNIENIISNLYSADTETFKTRAGITKRFVFVGRFVKVKAIDLLVNAYCMLSESEQKEWPLILIGDGDQKSIILGQKNPNIIVLPFLQPEKLREELLKGGVGCLPSHKDQWGIVLHEYALMGLPILASSGSGATTEFLISGFNGFMFNKGSVNDMYRAMKEFTSLTEFDISRFAENSTKLGQRITSDLSVASLLSVCHSALSK
jgi:glycosyltransferase involved in cell wall biosynthesis